MTAKIALSVVLCCAGLWNAASAEEPTKKPDEAATKKQPVFLLCPEHERYSSWSLYFTVDKKDPAKPLSLGLEELSQLNHKDTGYTKVLEAQENPATPKTDLATLDAKSFATGSLKVEKNNALNVTVTPDGDTYKLMIDLRIEQEKRFAIGGKDAKNNIVLKYNPALRAWGAYATSLYDHEGRNLVSGDPLRVTGLLFPVSSTAIVRIYAVLAGGKSVLIYDR